MHGLLLSSRTLLVAYMTATATAPVTPWTERLLAELLCLRGVHQGLPGSCGTLGSAAARRDTASLTWGHHPRARPAIRMVLPMYEAPTRVPAAECRFCGAPLKLLANAVSARCMVCGERGRTRTWCKEGHFVCEDCRGTELMGLLDGMLASGHSTDPVEAFLRMRGSHDFPMHGPEHHALVAAAFLLAYHSQHGEPAWADVLDALQSASSELPGGSCGYWGACSAGLAVGMAYCAILGSNPTNGVPRGLAHQAVAAILSRISGHPAPRCCRRECLLALQVACGLSADLLPHPLATSCPATCDQAASNPECSGAECPFFG